MPNEPFPPPIVPAEISVRDGALYSDRFGDIYHSVEGGVEEARHVFLAGNELPGRWKNGGRFTIVETGFGCGLNFLATWDELVKSSSNTQLDFVSVEKHPFSREDLAQVLQAWPQFETLSQKLRDVYPPLVPGFHRLHPAPRVTLTLLFGDALEQLCELDAHADAFYLDGFAPSHNPAMWSDDLFREIGRLAAPGATAATYSVAAKVRQGLAGAGFAVEKRVGFARKRQMLVARFPGARPANSKNRKVVIIGAGIAGASCALSLARRGVEVEMLERAQQPGAETSSNPAALIRPFVTLDNGVRSRFSWTAFSYAVRCYRELNNQAGFHWHETGVLQLARDQEHLERMVRALGQHALPHDLGRLVHSLEGTSLCGAQTSETGVWFPAAGYVDGALFCNAVLETSGPSIEFLPGIETASIKRVDGRWQILEAINAPLAQGDSVILANGCHAQALVPDHDLQIRPVRGQMTAIPSASRELRAPVCRGGYVTPEINGMHFVGGTFDESMSDAIVIEKDHDTNFSRAAHILPSVFENASTEIRSGWAGVRCVSRDRVPVVGKILEDVYVNLAMGSRGFTWAPLAGELLASAIAGASCPVERTVVNGMLPLRFLVGDKYKKRSQ